MFKLLENLLKMKRRIVLLYLTLILLTLACKKDEPQILHTEVEGRVINTSTNLPMANANVNIFVNDIANVPQGKLLSAVTDSNGQCYFEFEANEAFDYYFVIYEDDNIPMEFMGSYLISHAPYFSSKKITPGQSGLMELNPATITTRILQVYGDNMADSMSLFAKHSHLTDFDMNVRWFFQGDSIPVYAHDIPTGQWILTQEHWLAGSSTLIQDTVWIEPNYYWLDTIHF